MRTTADHIAEVFERLAPGYQIAVEAISSGPGGPEKRDREVAAGRRCATRALATIGVSGVVTTGERGMPVWPENLVGSITHTDDWAVAAVGRGRAIGIDLESVTAARRNPDLWDHVTTRQERAAYQIEPALVFSIKEAVYKCLFPIGKIVLGFADVELDARMQVVRAAGYAERPHVAYVIEGDHVMAVALL
ncbi:MAG: 4'-phosphopantetheinyl transferase superfamily protein [Kofleriaceae bacterium]